MTTRKGPLRADKLKYLPINKLQRGRYQPRRAMDGIALKRLAESIRAEGVLQPLFVRRVSRGKYEIVAGERRWRAAKIAGLQKVPVVIRNVSDQNALAIALIENLRREDLSPIEQAQAIQRLIEEFSMTHQQVAEVIGRSRATVTNLLRLLSLPQGVKTMLVDGSLEMGHARALLAMPTEQQLATAEFVASGKVSVREVERLAKASDVATAPEVQSSSLPAPPEWFKSSLEQHLGGEVGLRRDKQGRWRLNIAFTDMDDLRAALKTIDAALTDLQPAAAGQEASAEPSPTFSARASAAKGV
jgi:ParB family chromosome partitioning protein